MNISSCGANTPYDFCLFKQQGRMQCAPTVSIPQSAFGLKTLHAHNYPIIQNNTKKSHKSARKLYRWAIAFSTRSHFLQNPLALSQLLSQQVSQRLSTFSL